VKVCHIDPDPSKTPQRLLVKTSLEPVCGSPRRFNWKRNSFTFIEDTGTVWEDRAELEVTMTRQHTSPVNQTCEGNNQMLRSRPHEIITVIKIVLVSHTKFCNSWSPHYPHL
jgi:hypothetical protein